MKSKLILTKLLLLVVINLQYNNASKISEILIKKYKSYCEKNSYNCFKLNMLMEIRKMGRNKFYPITDDVWLERMNRPNATLDNETTDLNHLKLNKSDIKLNKIISELNNVFKTHSLYINMVPGKDLEIYRRNPDGKFIMKLEGDSPSSYPYYVPITSPSTFTKAGGNFYTYLICFAPALYVANVVFGILN